MWVKVGIGVVALLHAGFAAAEIFRWENVVKFLLNLETVTDDNAIRILLLNQGAYNAFFAVGLFAVLFGAVPARQRKALAVFCLTSLTAAGLVGLLSVRDAEGSLTLGSLVFLAQIIPAAATLWLVVRAED